MLCSVYFRVRNGCRRKLQGRTAGAGGAELTPCAHDAPHADRASAYFAATVALHARRASIQCLHRASVPVSFTTAPVFGLWYTGRS